MLKTLKHNNNKHWNRKLKIDSKKYPESFNQTEHLGINQYILWSSLHGNFEIGELFSLILTFAVPFETISLLVLPIFRRTFNFDQSAR